MNFLLLDLLKNKESMTKFLVIGDTIIDEEASCCYWLIVGVSDLKGSFRSRNLTLGGAANLVLHLSNFTKQIDFFTSSDDRGYELLKELNINVIKCLNRLQIKSRYWLERGDGLYKVLQINETSS